jgi:hypothetical protein
MEASALLHTGYRFATTDRINHTDVKQKGDISDEIPPDVLRGLAAHAGHIQATHPGWIVGYCQRLAALRDELHREGRIAEARNAEAFAALLAVAR